MSHHANQAYSSKQDVNYTMVCLVVCSRRSDENSFSCKHSNGIQKAAECIGRKSRNAFQSSPTWAYQHSGFHVCSASLSVTLLKRLLFLMDSTHESLRTEQRRIWHIRCVRPGRVWSEGRRTHPLGNQGRTSCTSEHCERSWCRHLHWRCSEPQIWGRQDWKIRCNGGWHEW